MLGEYERTFILSIIAGGQYIADSKHSNLKFLDFLHINVSTSEITKRVNFDIWYIANSRSKLKTQKLRASSSKRKLGYSYLLTTFNLENRRQ